jgi:hypothetical protein
MTKLNLETNPRNPLDVNIELASGAVLPRNTPCAGQIVNESKRRPRKRTRSRLVPAPM